MKTAEAQRIKCPKFKVKNQKPKVNVKGQSKIQEKGKNFGFSPRAPRLCGENLDGAF